MTETFRAELRRRKAEMDAESAEAAASSEQDAHVLAWRKALRLEKLEAARAEVPRPPPWRPVFDRDAPVFEIQRVPNPMMTAELLEAIESGELNVPRQVGASINLSSLIGGLARVDGRTLLQEQAAARYRSIREGAMIGGARSTDYAEPRVDVSMSAETRSADFGQDARAAYYAAYQVTVQRLGLLASNLVDKVVGEGCSLREVALTFGYGDSRYRREGLRHHLLAALDVLVEHFRIGGSPRGKITGEGLAPMNASTDVVIRTKACA